MPIYLLVLYEEMLRMFLEDICKTKVNGFQENNTFNLPVRSPIKLSPFASRPNSEARCVTLVGLRNPTDFSRKTEKGIFLSVA